MEPPSIVHSKILMICLGWLIFGTYSVATVSWSYCAVALAVLWRYATTGWLIVFGRLYTARFLWHALNGLFLEHTLWLYCKLELLCSSFGGTLEVCHCRMAHCFLVDYTQPDSHDMSWMAYFWYKEDVWISNENKFEFHSPLVSDLI